MAVKGIFWHIVEQPAEEADEPAESDMVLADAEVVEPEGSYDPEVAADYSVEADTEQALVAEAEAPEGDPLESDLVEPDAAEEMSDATNEGEAPAYAEYEIVAVMVEPSVEDGEAAEPGSDPG